MEPYPQPDTEAVAALPAQTQEELLDAIRHSIYNQLLTDWSKVTNLGVMRAVPEVKQMVNRAPLRLLATIFLTPSDIRAAAPFAHDKPIGGLNCFGEVLSLGRNVGQLGYRADRSRQEWTSECDSERDRQLRVSATGWRCPRRVCPFRA
jgi:hypothetical protein